MEDNPMKYSELDSNVKKSFNRTMTNSIDDLLSERDYVFDTVDNEFVLLVVEDMKWKTKAGFQQWAKVEFDIDDDEMTNLVVSKVEALRKRKPTLKQIGYFNGMCSQLGKDLSVPGDFIVFQQMIRELKNEYNYAGPATETQKKSIKQLWINTFGEELDLDSGITRGEIQSLFERVSAVKIK
jgi:hypothetical protein